MAAKAQRAPTPARDQPAAPRLPVSKESLAATFAAAQKAGAPIAADFPVDEVRNILGEVQGLVELLSAGVDKCQQRDDVSQGEMLSCNSRIYARALDGLNRLVGLADFHAAMANGDRP